jgi:phosphopantothenoylcysteine synthetase/decarboxylase
MPGEGRELARADAVIAAPMTFNTINKWALGITDNFATGLLCELTGYGVPIVAVPMLKPALARHLTFQNSLHVLRQMGVTLMWHPPTWSDSADSGFRSTVFRMCSDIPC